MVYVIYSDFIINAKFWLNKWYDFLFLLFLDWLSKFIQIAESPCQKIQYYTICIKLRVVFVDLGDISGI